MTKLAMGRIWAAKLKERYDLVFYAPIHDEVVFSINMDDMPEAIPEIHALMTAQYADMWIPVESSVSFGFNFGEQHEMSEQSEICDCSITPENIRKVVQHLVSEKVCA